MARGTALFGRRYKIVIADKGTTGIEVSDLHCIFTVEKSMASRPNFSSVKLFNLAPDTQDRILTTGRRVIIEAGYDGAQYGMIYDGDVVQILNYAEDNVSEVTEILSQDGDRFLNAGFVSASYGAGETPSSVLSSFAGQTDPDMAMGTVSDSMSGTQLARGKTVFGQPRDYARSIAQGEGALFYINDRKINLVKPTDIPPGEIISLAPDSGLIGMPEQTDNGIKAKCLLNPLLNLNRLVYIDNNLVKEQSISAGQYYRRRLTSGVYRIITMTHSGDTRGDDWYTDFTGIAQPGLIPQTGKSFSK